MTPQQLKTEMLKQFTAEELADAKELRDIIMAENVRKKPVRKARKEPVNPAIWERWYSAHLAWFKSKFPTTHRDGHYLQPKQPDITKANGLGWFIVDYMDWTGGDGDKKHVTGRKVDGVWIPTTTKKGQADIECVLKGITFHCEIKVGKDKPRPAQLERQAKYHSMGVIYEFIHDPAEFFAVYDRVSSLRLF